MAGGHKATEHLRLPKGYRLDDTGIHRRIICPDGEPLRMPTGIPVLISLSPGIPRTKRIEAARVKQAIQHKEGR